MPEASDLPAYFQYKPHSISDRAYWEKIKAEPLLAPMVGELAKQFADLPQDPTQPKATDYLAAKRKNDRSVIDQYWQRTRPILSQRVYARCQDGAIERGVDDALLNWLWSVSTTPTWVLSAHLPKNDLQFTSGPQLDLSACDTASNLAEIVEILKPWIDNQSATLADTILYEIDRRVLSPFVEGENEWWYRKNSMVNNWTGVCSGCILAICDSFESIGKPRPDARKKALHFLNVYLEKGFTRSGECDEGIGYWAYGISMATLGLSRLSKEELDREINVKRLAEVVDYPRRAHIVDCTFVAGNDAAPNVSAPMSATVWLAAATGNQWLIEWTHASPASAGTRASVPGVGRVIDARLRLAPRAPNFPPVPDGRFLPDQQIATFRSGELIVTFNGGHNAESHNHNDLGHFSVWKHDKEIVIDLGCPRYTADIFGPKRYTYLATSSRGHCCPIINDQEQIPGRAAAAKVVELDLEKQRCTLDLTAAYAPAAKLARWTRATNKIDSTYEIVDEFCTTEGVTIENAYWSAVEPKVAGSTVTLGPITLTFQTPAEIVVEPVDPKPHRLMAFSETIYRLSIKLKTSGTDPVQLKMTVALVA